MPVLLLPFFSVLLLLPHPKAKAVIDDYMDYYNNDRGQWELLKLTPNEYYEYCITGIYPLISYNQSEKGNCPQEK